MNMTPSLLPLFFLVSHFFILSYAQDSPSNLCNPHDKDVLLRIKKFWGNPSSLDHWNPDSACCAWDLIGCDEHGNVKKLGIDYAPDIHGSLPPFLDQLPYLIELQFNSMFNITEPMPSYFGKLTNLTVLIISGTSIGGHVPDFIANLINLNQLDLSRNSLTGPIPDFIGQLKSLTLISFFFNNLTGTIPPSIAQLPKLTLLYLGNNKLSGPIPDFPTSDMDLIDLSFNRLSGSIPASIGRLPKLTILFLENNKLRGMIPTSFVSTNLISIALQNNSLTGDASFLFDKNNKVISYINISYNRLKFQFNKVDMPRSLTYVYINHNKIYGRLPLGFGLLSPQNFDVSDNRLCGPIPNGRRFKNVKVDIFANNKCLCGGPFPACK